MKDSGIKVELKFPDKYWQKFIKELQGQSEMVGVAIAMAISNNKTKASVFFDCINPLQKDSLKAALEQQGCKIKFEEIKTGTFLDIDLTDFSFAKLKEDLERKEEELSSNNLNFL